MPTKHCHFQPKHSWTHVPTWSRLSITERGSEKPMLSLAWKPQSAHTASWKVLGLFPRPLKWTVWGTTDVLGAWDFSMLTSLTHSRTVQGLNSQDFLCLFQLGRKDSVQAICSHRQEPVPQPGADDTEMVRRMPAFLILAKKPAQTCWRAMMKHPHCIENQSKSRCFPGGPVVKNPPANAEDTSSIPGPGRSHVLRGD